MTGLRDQITRDAALDHAQTVAAPGPLECAGPLRQIKRFIHSRSLTPRFLSQNPPWFNARGVAFGLAVGLLCPMGLQLPSVTLLRLALKFNVVVALAFSLVSNPFTFVPLYYGYYLFGSLILGRPASMSVESFETIINSVAGSGYFLESTSSFLGLGREILARWFVSAVFFASVFSVFGYLATYWFEENRQAKPKAPGEIPQSQDRFADLR